MLYCHNAVGTILISNTALTICKTYHFSYPLKMNSIIYMVDIQAMRYTGVSHPLFESNDHLIFTFVHQLFNTVNYRQIVHDSGIELIQDKTTK